MLSVSSEDLSAGATEFENLLAEPLNTCIIAARGSATLHHLKGGRHVQEHLSRY